MSSKSFRFDTAATEWTVTHNLTRTVCSDVYIFDSQDRPVKVFPLDIVKISEDVIKITFSKPKKGMVMVF